MDYERIAQTIDAMNVKYGELVTYRTARGCLAIDMPLALVHKANGQGVDADIALQTLAGLLVPQLDRIPASIMQTALADDYTGKRSDYMTLVAKACNDLKT